MTAPLHAKPRASETSGANGSGGTAPPSTMQLKIGTRVVDRDGSVWLIADIQQEEGKTRCQLRRFWGALTDQWRPAEHLRPASDETKKAR
ncbi:MAG: hypothetical protein ACRYG5_06015 [Janthinobacterium lividum]